jgi:hypothetical protein
MGCRLPFQEKELVALHLDLQVLNLKAARTNGSSATSQLLQNIGRRLKIAVAKRI